MRTPIDNFDDFSICPLVAYGRKTRVKDNGVEIPLSLTLAKVEPDVVPRVLRARTTLATAFSTYCMDDREGTSVFTILPPQENYRYFLIALKDYFITTSEYLAQGDAYGSLLNKLFKEGPWDPSKVYGGMLYNNLETSGYAQQACSLVLRSDITLDTLLHLMQSSLRWLSDKPGVMKLLEELFVPQGQHPIDHHQNLINVLTGN